MSELVAFALGLLIGLASGFYAYDLRWRVNHMLTAQREQRQAKQTGVVRPERRLNTRSQPIDLSTNTGSIMRLTPEQHALRAQKERNDRLQHM